MGAGAGQPQQLLLNAGGRKNVLWCGGQLWMSTSNGADINRGVCEVVRPTVSDVVLGA